MALTVNQNSRFNPSKVQTPNPNEKLISCTWAAISSGSVPGASLPNGVQSITHTSTGLYTITLQDIYKGVVSVIPSIQVASPSSTSALATVTWTDATDSDTIQFIAGPLAPGVQGNALKVAVTVAAANTTSVAYSSGIETVTFTTTATLTPTAFKTYVNTTAPNGLVTIGTTTGTTDLSINLSPTALTGGVAATASLVAQVGTVTLAPAGPLGTQIQVRVVAPVSGSVTDLAVAAGNNINCDIIVKVR